MPRNTPLLGGGEQGTGGGPGGGYSGLDPYADEREERNTNALLNKTGGSSLGGPGGGTVYGTPFTDQDSTWQGDSGSGGGSGSGGNSGGGGDTGGGGNGGYTPPSYDWDTDRHPIGSPAWIKDKKDWAMQVTQADPERIANFINQFRSNLGLSGGGGGGASGIRLPMMGAIRNSANENATNREGRDQRGQNDQAGGGMPDVAFGSGDPATRGQWDALWNTAPGEWVQPTDWDVQLYGAWDSFKDWATAEGGAGKWLKDTAAMAALGMVIPYGGTIVGLAKWVLRRKHMAGLGYYYDDDGNVVAKQVDKMNPDEVLREITTMGEFISSVESAAGHLLRTYDPETGEMELQLGDYPQWLLVGAERLAQWYEDSGGKEGTGKDIYDWAVEDVLPAMRQEITRAGNLRDWGMSSGTTIGDDWSQEAIDRFWAGVKATQRAMGISRGWAPRISDPITRKVIQSQRKLLR